MSAADPGRDPRDVVSRRAPSSRANEPRRVGRYEILAKIASGGMGSVYWARATGPSGFAKDVAIKLTHPHLREAADGTLLDEAKLAVRVKHANVVEVIDLGDDGESLYLVMEYVRGGSLSAVLSVLRERGQPLPLPIAGRILVDALRGLAAVHELVDDDGASLGVIHRDVSPHNLLIGLDGVTKLTDFGVAKMRNRAIETASGLVKGKVAYMSPEQARAHPLDQRSDVWSAGVVAWEVFANRRLFDSTNEVDLLLRLVSDTPPLLSEVGVNVPRALEEAVRDALVPDRERRIASAAELGKRISLAIGELSDPAAVSAFIRPLVEDKLAERQREAKRRAAEDASPANAGAEDDAGAASGDTVPNEPATRTTNLVTMSDAVVLPRRSWRPTGPLLGALAAGVIAAGIYASSREPSTAASAQQPGASTAPSAVSTPKAALSETPSVIALAPSAPTGAPAPSESASGVAKGAPAPRPSAPPRHAPATAAPKATEDAFESPYR